MQARQLFIEFVADSTKFRGEMNKVLGEVKHFGSEVKGAISSLTGIGVGLGAAFGLEQLAESTKHMMEFVDSIDDASTAAGLAVETFQAWQGATKRAGVSQDEFVSAMQRSNVFLGKFLNGSTEATQALARFGVEMKGVHDNESFVRAVADRIEELGQGAEAAALSAQVFGRFAGPKLVEFLAEGSKGIDEQAQKIRALGGVISADVVKKGAEAQKQMETLSGVMRAQTSVALANLIPAITGIGNAFVWVTTQINNASKWYRTLALKQLAEDAQEAANKVTVLNEKIRAISAMPSNGEDRGADSKLAQKWRDELARAEIEYRNKKAAYDRYQRQLSMPASEAPPAPPRGGDDPTDRGKPKCTPVEKPDNMLARWFGDLNRDFDQDMINVGNTAGEHVKAEFAKSLDEMKKEAEDWRRGLDETTQGAAQTLGDEFGRLMHAGFSGGLKSMKQEFLYFIEDLAMQWAKSEIVKLLAGGMKGMLGGSQPGSGGSAGGLLQTFIGVLAGRASGGMVAAGTPYIVGEQGPELFVPSTTGNVVPNNALGGGSQNVTIVNQVNAQGADANVDARIRMAMDATNKQTVAQVRDLIRRGRL